MAALRLAAIALTGCLAEPSPPSCPATRPLTELDTPAEDMSPWMSEDRRWILFHRFDRTTNKSIVFEARRNSATDAFDTVVPVTQGIDLDFDPVGSEDGNTVWYVEGDGTLGDNILAVQRKPDGTFGPPMQAFAELGPVLHPRFTRDQLTIVYGYPAGVAIATRPDLATPFTTEVATLGNAREPTITADGATVYFQAAVDPPYMLQQADRSGTGFTNVHPVVIDGLDDAGWPSIQSDGKTLLVSALTGTSLDVWIVCE